MEKEIKQMHMANDILLKIEGLRASVEDKEILKGVDLPSVRVRFML